VSDVSFRRMTLPTLEPFRSTSVTAVVRRERGTEVTYPTVIGIRSRFPVLCNPLVRGVSTIPHSSDSVNLWTFHRLGRSKPVRPPRHTAGGLKRAPTAYILSERTADGSDVDNQISFTSKHSKQSDPGTAGDWHERRFLRSLRSTVTFSPSCTPMCSSQESAAE
jgi:hypothetical protein